MKRFWAMVGVGGLLLVVIALSSLSLYSQSIRLDESQSIWAATKPVAAIFEYTAQDVHVPLYSLLLHFWTQLFGTDIVLARTLSMLFFIATLPILYLLTKEASDKKVALFSTILFSLSPFVSWYSNEARMYTLFTFIATLSHLYFLRLVRSEAGSGKVGYIISAVLGLYTHYFFLLVIASQVVYVAIKWWQRIQAMKQTVDPGFWKLAWRERRWPVRFGVLLIIAVLLFTPWLLYVFGLGSASNTQPSLTAPSSYNILQTFIQFVFGFQVNTVQSLLVSLWPLSVLLLFFVFTKKQGVTLQQTGYFALATFLPVMLAFAISYIQPVFLSRYLIFTTPTLFLLISALILNYSKKASTILASTIVAAMFILLFYQNTSASTPVKENYQGARIYLEAHATPQDIVVISSPFTIYPLEYQYSGSAKMTTIPEWNRYIEGSIPEFSLQKLEEQLNTYEDQYQNMYVILSYDQGYEDDIRRYLENNYQRIDRRKFSSDVEMSVYKLRYEN